MNIFEFVKVLSKIKILFIQFLQPFTWKVWLITLLAIILSGLVLQIFERYARNTNKSRSSKLNTQESYWFIVGAVAGGGTETVPMSIPGK